MVASGTLSLQDDEAERSIQISHTIFSEFIHSTLEKSYFSSLFAISCIWADCSTPRFSSSFH